MIQTFASYKIKLKDEPFKTVGGIKYPSTVTISFFDNFKKEIGYLEKAYVDAERVYGLIDKGQEINLDECYIENLSISEYRKSRKLEKKEIIEIKQFSACNAIFDSNLVTDFSYTSFESGCVKFENSYFLNGATSFYSANFGNFGIDFSYVIFRNGEVDFSNVKINKGEVVFKNAVFGEGTKNFQYANFGNGEVSFVNAEFGKGDVLFINTDFGIGNVSYKVARFGEGRKDFHYASFGAGDISFERVEFGDGRVDFRVVEFNEGKVNFNRAIFKNGEVNFEACQIKKGRINLKRIEFGDGDKIFELIESSEADLILERSIFGTGNVSFRKSNIKALSLKSCHLDNYFDLRLKQCEFVDLSDTIVRDIIDFIPHDFDVKIKKLNLSGMRLLGSVYIDWERNRIKEIIDSPMEFSYKEKAEQFRLLKENFNKTGQYNNEDKSYVEFKRNEQKSELIQAIEKKSINSIWAYPYYWFKQLIFDKIGLYATSPIRVLVSMIIAYLIFSVIYLGAPYISSADILPSSGEMDLSLTARSFYHSAITFLTIGYGDHYPVGLARIISSIEGFVGLFLMSYFTVAFVHKVLR